MAFDRPYEPKPNSGSLFLNDRKTTDKHPDRTGQGLIECPHCGKTWQAWISGWLKEKNGKKYMNLAFQEKKDDRGGGQRSGGGGGGRRDDDRGGGRRAGPDTRGSYRDKEPDDIPFAWLIVAGALLTLSTAHGFIA